MSDEGEGAVTHALLIQGHSTTQFLSLNVVMSGVSERHGQMTRQAIDVCILLTGLVNKYEDVSQMRARTRMRNRHWCE